MLVPALHPNTAQINLQQPEFLVETPCDITRAALNLVLSGTLERYPSINWILAEGGGFLPYISWRVSLANAMAEYSTDIPMGMMNYLRRFYFVTTRSHSSFQIASMQELGGDHHLLYGSGAGDFSLDEIKNQTIALEKTMMEAGLSKTLVGRDNALRLFPAYTRPGQSVQAAPRYQHAPAAVRLRSRLLSPLIKIDDK
ncbi:MAG: amidohydrolase, partial [Thalassolituus sp. CG17_big_fil_post_rev_8_21_14_2_50_53_8]